MRRINLLLIILNFVVQIYCQHGNGTAYNAEELLLKIFNINETIAPRQSYASIKFEDNFKSQIDESNNSDKPIIFEGQPRPDTSFKFDDDQIYNGYDIVDVQQINHEGVIFQDDNEIEESSPPKKKRRRKPNIQNSDNQGLPYQIFPGQYPEEPQRYQNNEPNQPVTFNDQTSPNINDDFPNFQQIKDQNITQDDNKLGEPKPHKKRRRRRKPRYQNVQYPAPYQLPQGFPSQYPGNLQGYPVQNPNVVQGYPNYPGNFQGHPGQQGVPAGPSGQYYRPPRRPKQSLASEALTAITGALTSIALYDDYQCVPRLLCEAAGGGALGSSGILQNIAGLQPLLTLLAAYNGISSSPLFIFGRAVFLGMTAKGNVGTCRYAYPQCPTDTEQLVHYLNNHNGGFFRFFNAPHLNNPQYGLQNVEQFYNQLSQNYGLYQQEPQQTNQNYGIYQPNISNQQNGIYQQNVAQAGNLNSQVNQQGFGLLDPNYGERPQNYGYQNYVSNYPYQNSYGFNRYKSNNNKNQIEKRIINGPVDFNNDIENIESPKWLSLESSLNDKYFNNNRGGRVLKFPDEEVKTDQSLSITSDNVRQGKAISFPGQQNNIKYVNFNTIPSITPSYNKNDFYQNRYNIGTHYMYQTDHITNIKYYDNNQVNKQNGFNINGNDEEIQTVYIVRGNGDPNNPEIVKLKPGEKV